MKNYNKAGIIISILVLLFIFSFEVNSANNYEKEGLAIPKAYPVRLIPLLDGYNIVLNYFANQGEHQEIWLKYMIDVEFNKVIDFYKEVLSPENLNNFDILGNELCILEGELEDKIVEIRITTEILFDNYQSYVRIYIKGDLEVIDEINSEAVIADLSSANKDIIDIDLLPEEYPIDLIPVYGASKIKYGELTHGEKYDYEKRIFLIEFCSRDTNKEIINFYREVLKNAANKEEGVLVKLNEVIYILAGVLKNYKTNIVISDVNIEGFAYTTLINLRVEILK